MSSQIRDHLIKFLYRNSRPESAKKAIRFHIEIGVQAWRRLQLECGFMDDLKGEPGNRSFYSLPIKTPPSIGQRQWRIVNANKVVVLEGHVPEVMAASGMDEAEAT
jgi:hypothetical protein